MQRAVDGQVCRCCRQALAAYLVEDRLAQIDGCGHDRLLRRCAQIGAGNPEKVKGMEHGPLLCRRVCSQVAQLLARAWVNVDFHGGGSL
jgi:hypothetical protein